MATAEQLARTLRERFAERQVKADLRAQRLRELLPRATRLLVEQYQARRILLFGSLAVGGHSERSDVDLAVEGMPSSLYFGALADLMALFGGPVDLARIEEAVPSLRAAIEQDGRVL